MRVDTKPVTTPTTPARPARRGHRGLRAMRLPRRAHHGSSVVRVRLGRRRLYAYRVQGVAHVGDQVIVDAPFSGTVVTPVVALGRGAYAGPLQTAILIGGTGGR